MPARLRTDSHIQRRAPVDISRAVPGDMVTVCALRQRCRDVFADSVIVLAETAGGCTYWCCALEGVLRTRDPFATSCTPRFPKTQTARFIIRVFIYYF